MKLYILVGAPGAGKSTWIKKNMGKYLQENTIVVSSDAIREEIYGDASIQTNPSMVFKIAHNRTRAALKNNRDVVFDATNVDRKSRKTVIDIGKQCGAYVEIVFLSTPVEVCIENNLKRERKVPEAVIYKMFHRFEMPAPIEGYDYLNIVEVD